MRQSHLKQFLETAPRNAVYTSGRIVVGFDGTATVSGQRTGVQAHIKPHALFVHCHCHLVQLACVQAAKE